MSPSYLASVRNHRVAFLRRQFPTIPLQTLLSTFPLFDPLDLDVIVSWTIPEQPSRQGRTVLHGIRVSPEFSIVEDVRRQVALAIAKGGKQTRTMYEETGRLRRVLLASVLDGVLGQEEDPVIVRLGVSSAKRGRVEHDFDQG